ncbi:MAG: hypothetical protein K2Y01_06905 [Rhabdochlamydiaceae bacterium]|nr:hypothetical protein [Rhabdochlamydiaceae bacterium]
MRAIQNHYVQVESPLNLAKSVLETNSTIYKIRSNCEQTQKNFDATCNQAGSILDKKPTTYKVAIIAIHIFRAIAILGMIEMTPFSPLTSLAILIPASLLYRAAVERFCTFRFTLPALVGGTAMWMTKQALISLAVKSAFSSIGTLFAAGLAVSSLAGYLIYICYLSHFDIERRMQNLQKSCCS